VGTDPRIGTQSVGPSFVARAEARGVIPACRGADPVLFFPERKGPSRQQVAQARVICGRCPLLAECRDYALSMSTAVLYGVWGGLTHDERITLAAHR
jgi:WhiB family redox-sensing transcriptional regulator